MKWLLTVCYLIFFFHLFSQHKDNSTDGFFESVPLKSGVTARIDMGDNFKVNGEKRSGLYLTNGRSEILFSDNLSRPLTTEWWGIGNLQTESAAIIGDSTEIRFKCGGTGAAPFWIFPHKVRIVADTFNYTNGTEGIGKVLVSDAYGNATWGSASATAWGLSGNSGTSSDNFIGTTDTDILRFKVQGKPAGLLSIARFNTSFGAGALKNAEDAKLMEANTAIGSGALNMLVDSGRSNTGIGNGALRTLEKGSFNTAVGNNAMGMIAEGSFNTAIGYNATVAFGANNAVALGRDAVARSERLGLSPYIKAITPGGNLTTDIGRDGIQFDSLYINHIKASGNISAANLTSGTYVPKLTQVNNLSEAKPYKCRYTRIGNVVTVSGAVYITRAKPGLFILGLSLPIPTDIVEAIDVTGIGTASGESEVPLWILGKPEADRASIRGSGKHIENHDYFFYLTYEVK